MSSTVTITEIARQCQVSHGTVSRVLNNRLGGKFSVRDELRQTILDTASRLNYRPNVAARAMSRRRFNNVSMLLGRRGQFLPPGLILGASEALAARDMTLSISEQPDDKLTNAGYVPKMLRELSADGLLINYIIDIPPEMDRLIRGHHVPSIWVNVKAAVDCIYPDDYAGARIATRALFERGHRRIALIYNAAGVHYSDADRHRGYVDEMREAGQSPRLVSQSVAGWNRDLQASDSDDRLARSFDLLAQPDRPTAVLATHPNYSQPLLHAAAQRGLRVPRDLSVITFADWIPDALGMTEAFVHLPMTRVGREAVELLARKIEDPSLELPGVAVPVELRDGQTLAPRFADVSN